jgi:glycosyltransferase involved in cell wall biosynthesis
MILHINTAKTWRGGEQQLLYLANGLLQRGIPQVFVGQPNSELEARMGHLNFFGVPMRGEWDIFCIPKILQIIDKFSIRLIHTHTARAHTIGLFLKLFRPKTILIVSRRVDFSINKGLGSRWKYLSSKNDLFLGVSNKIREVLVSGGVSPEKVITVHSGIDLDRFVGKTKNGYLRKEFSIPPRTVILGNVAALVDHKDQKTLLKAISLIPATKKLKLFILGEGELEQELKKLVHDLQLEDRVIFTGFRRDIKEFLQFMHIFVLTSKEEGLGTAVLDAMANGLPVVATSAGGIGEMVDHDKGGYLASVGNAVEISECIEKLVSNSALRKRFGEYNLNLVKDFSVQKTIEKTIQAYSLFLGEKFYS